jgi:hypothetical protein
MLWTMKKPKLLAEGLDPDDPAVIAALDLVRWELSLLRVPGVASGGVDPEMSFDEIRALLQNPRKG